MYGIICVCNEGEAVWHEVVKLVYLIPCHNHVGVVGQVIADLPQTMAGFDAVVSMVVDAGSTDGTAAAARKAGADAVVRLPISRGIVDTCVEGLQRCLEAGADVIVIVDAQGLYAVDAVPALVAPIVARQADLVVGDRGAQERSYDSLLMLGLNWIAMGIVRMLSGSAIPDPQCSFRAMSREAAMRLSTGNQHTFAESVIRAGHLDLPMASVPVEVIATPRETPSAAWYMVRAAGATLRVFVSYKPFKAFALPGSALCLGGTLLAARFLHAYLSGLGQGMVQSLILATLLLSTGAFLFLCGVLAELLSTNRAIEEDIRFRLMNLQGRLGRAARGLDGPA